MTESEWLSSSDPATMLAHLGDKASARKLRLFATSACRQVWDGVPCPQCSIHGSPLLGKKSICPVCSNTRRIGGLTDPRSRRAVEVAELYADGEATKGQLVDACNAAMDCRHSFWPGGGNDEATAASWAASQTALDGVRGVLQYIRSPAVQAALLREIVGNPFSRPEMPSHWPSAVTDLARAVYAGDDCAYALHDAMIDAGHADLAAHFREREHPKGCWLVDEILGKR